MNIYLLERPEGDAGYGEVESVVVVANTPAQARSHFAALRMIDDGPAGEGATPWLQARCSSCTLVGVAHRRYAEPAVICRNFNAA